MGDRFASFAGRAFRQLAVSVALLVLTTGCGSWIVHEAMNPKGGVMGYKRENRVMADIRAYCGGPFQVVSRWDAPPTDGPVSYTIGGRTHTAFLQAGYYYFAFVCGASNDMPGVQGVRAPMGEDVKGWDEAGARAGYGPGGSEQPVAASDRDMLAFTAALAGSAIQESIEGCRLEQLGFSQLPSGSIYLVLTVAPDGRVTGVEIAERTKPVYLSAYLSGCLVKEAWAFKFPPSSAAVPVYFEFAVPVE